MNYQRLGTTLVRWIFIIIVILFFIWAFKKGYFSHIYNKPEQFFVLLKQHLQLVGLSSLLAISIAIPTGIFVTRQRFSKFRWFFMGIANIGQTVPSLAVLAIAMSFLGIGFKPTVFALFVYSILPILRNTVAGIESIDPKLIDAAKGMGFKPRQILMRIEIPNAAYSIMAGIRTSIVINIGTAALAFIIGGGGLGIWIYNGINLFDNSLLISGAVPITLMAISFDYLLRLTERLVVPKPFRHSIHETN